MSARLGRPAALRGARRAGITRAMTDPALLTAALVRCPSVTPAEGGALVLLEDLLAGAGFECTRVDRGGVPNLFARWGRRGANRSFGFNGHTDVVPVGDEAAWTHPPFGAVIEDGWLYGRGATDMKSGVAAFAAAAVDFVRDTPPDGAVILAITGDEEGDSRDGTPALLDWMRAHGEAMTDCLVGEPTSPETFGEAMKIGRRGTMNAWIDAHGTQGHSAYPERTANPVAAVATLIHRLQSDPLDAGTEHFDPSNFEVTTIDTGNPATNVVPARCRATLNVRFNDRHDGASIAAWIDAAAARVAQESGVAIETRHKVGGEAFLTAPGPLTELIAAAAQAETGARPAMTTTGGTSDARFVKDHCPVAEFGLVGHRMHAVDERVRVEQIHALKSVYGRILRDYFA